MPRGEALGNKSFCYLNNFNNNVNLPISITYGSRNYSYFYLSSYGYIRFTDSNYYDMCDDAAAKQDSMNYTCSAISVFNSYNFYFGYSGRLCRSNHYLQNSNSTSWDATIDNYMISLVEKRLQRAGVQIHVKSLIVVTWENISMYSWYGNQMLNETITAQLVLASDGVLTYLFLNYPYGQMNFPQQKSYSRVFAGYSFTDDFNRGVSRWLGYWAPSEYYWQNNENSTVIGINPFTMDKQNGSYGKIVLIS